MLLLIRPYTLSATSSQCIAAAHGSSIPNCKDSAEEDMMCSVILMNMLLVHETHDVGYTVDTRRRSLTAIMISTAMQASSQRCFFLTGGSHLELQRSNDSSVKRSLTVSPSELMPKHRNAQVPVGDEVSTAPKASWVPDSMERSFPHTPLTVHLRHSSLSIPDVVKPRF